MKLLKPKALKPGSTIGVFTPSFPAHTQFRAKYLHGLEVLKRMGFEVLEGELTATAKAQGYRSGTPQERASELMGLWRNPKVGAVISTIGGNNSSSMIPYLDFEEMRRHPKILCGYSDVTSLHLSILKYAGVSTFYGPAVMPSFGEWPDMLEETRASFLDATQRHLKGERKLTPPKRWSNHMRSAMNDDWKTQARKFEDNPGWGALNPGEAEAPIIVANTSTLMTAAGTPYFPDLAGKILLVESMNAPLSTEERNFRHLERLGAFDVIKGLIVGKPEVYNAEGAPFGHEDLVLEVVGRDRKYPIVTGFDCAHTNPMLTIAEGTRVRLTAKKGTDSAFTVLEPMVES